MAINSFAAWYRRKTVATANTPALQLHLNLWRFKHQKYSRSGVVKFLDIGVKLSDPINVESISIFMPFLVIAQDISDLGIKFRQNPSLLSAIFNESYDITSIAEDQQRIDVSKSGVVKFSIRMLDKDTDIGYQNHGEGTIITIRTPEENFPSGLYYRIRINSNKVNDITHRYSPKNRVIESAFYKTEFTDLRINEKRSLDKELIKKIGNISFERVDFFLICEASHDYLLSYPEPNSIRALEKDMWESYLDCPNGQILPRLLAFHWKKIDAQDFSAFAKYKFWYTSWKTIIGFIIILIMIGTAGSLLAVLFTGGVR